jgi:putative ABC transport system permease protein
VQLLRLISWPYARKHLLRYALSVVGIALGIGVAVAIQGGTQTVLSDFRQTVDQIAGSCQLQVAAGEAGVPEAFIEKLQALPQVRAASPVVEALAETDVAGTRLLIVGLDITGDAAMRPWLFRTSEGSVEVDPITFIAQPDSLLMSRSFAASHGWDIGSKVGLHTMDGLKAFTVRGLLSDESLEKIYGGNVAVMDVFGAQRVFGRGSSVDRIEIALTEGTALEDGRAAIRRVVGPGYTVDPPSARGEQFEDLVKSYETLEAMACLFAIALGICMIDASFRLAVAQRRTEIGILRALGATRRQIQSLFLWEGLITGVLGSIFGLALGIRLFAVGSRLAGTMFRSAFGGLADQTDQIHVSPLMMVVAFLAGIGISLVASWLPARDAARANPVEAFRPMHYQRSLTAWRPRALLWSGLLALGALAGGTQEGSTTAFYISMVLLFAAVVLAIPTFVLGAVYLLRPLLIRVVGLESTLALDSLAAAPRRTVATMIVLVLIFGQAVTVAGTNRSVQHTLELWVDRAFQADLVLSASANLASQSLRFPPHFEDTLRAIPGIAAVQPVRSVRVPLQGTPVLIIATNYAVSAGKTGQRVISGNWREMCLKTAREEGVFISEALARLTRLKRGSQLELTAPNGTLRLPVVGIVNDHSDKRGVIFLSLPLYRRYWNDQTTDKFRIDAAPGVTVDQLRARIREALADRYPASLMSKQQMHDYVFHPRGDRLGPLEYQLLICLAVAALALMNMALISVADRGREFAVLRAIGAFRAQVRKTLLVEMLVTGGLSLLLGLALGAALLLYLLAAIHRYLTGVNLEYAFPWNAVLWLVCVAIAAGPAAVLAAIPAMRRVSLSVALDSE